MYCKFQCTLLICIVLTIPFLVHMILMMCNVHMPDYFNYIQLALATIIEILAGGPFFLGMLRDFKNKKLVKEAEQLITQQATEVIDQYGEKVLQALNDSKKYGKLGAFKDMDELTSQKKSSSQAVEKMNKDLKDIINELERKSLKDCAEDMLVNDIKTFFNDYFKSIKLKYQDREKIDILIEKFKNNLADYNDFLEYVTDLSWTDDYESEREKYYNPLGFVEEMRDRLDRMVELSKTGEYRKTLKK